MQQHSKAILFINFKPYCNFKLFDKNSYLVLIQTLLSKFAQNDHCCLPFCKKRKVLAVCNVVDTLPFENDYLFNNVQAVKLDKRDNARNL